jgi:hypothetical protein
MLAAFFVWGVSTAPSGVPQVIAGLGAPLASMVVWGALLAPRSVRRLRTPARSLAEAGLFALASISLGLAGRPELGLIFAGAAITRFALGRLSGVDRD